MTRAGEATGYERAKKRNAQDAARDTVGAMRTPSPREAQQVRERLLRWFEAHGRRFPWRKKRATLYQLVLPEILLQRTRAEAVAAFLPDFMRRYPSWRALACALEEELGEFLRPLGLWKRRSTSLLALAREMEARGGRFPKERVDIETLPGVGQYIANAICLFALKQPEPLLDVSMARVLERCFGPRKLVDIRYDPRLQGVSRIIVGGPESVAVNWAILDLAAIVCQRTDPRCVSCPLLGNCAEGERRVGRATRQGLERK